jgi:regulator of replication initiation timing
MDSNMKQVLLHEENEELQARVDSLISENRRLELEVRVRDLKVTLARVERRLVEASIAYQNMSRNPEKCALHLEELRIALYNP